MLEIAKALGDLAFELQGQPDPDATLKTIVSSASVIVPGVSWAGISLVRGKTVTPSAFTDDVAHALDTLQSDLGEGPATDTLTLQRTVVIPDLSAEDRWPRFARAATERGVYCMASFRLFVDRGDLGVLTLYGPRPRAFDEDGIFYGELLAQHAAVAMAGAQAEEQMQRAIASRDVIGQAKGIIMERFHVNAVRAFELLTRLSQENNVKLLDVARRIIATTDDTAPPSPNPTPGV